MLKDVLGFFGMLLVNFNLVEDYLLDFGMLMMFGYGVNWVLVEGVWLIVLVIDIDEVLIV